MILTALPEEIEAEEQTGALLYHPEPMQRAFHLCPADHVLYGGAAGGGKTIALTMQGILCCMEEPGLKAIYFRLTFDDLQQQIDETKRFVPESVATFNETRHRWVFAPRPNPNDPKKRPRESYFNFRYLKNESDALGYWSREYDIVMFDEASQFSQNTIELLTTRLRTSLPGGWARLRMGTNPGGIGHQYLLHNWVEPPDDDYELIARWDWNTVAPDHQMGAWIKMKPGSTGRVEPMMVWRPHQNDLQREENEWPATRAFIPAKVDDNPHVDRGYKRSLMALSDPDLRRALLDGDWHVFAGQAFGRFQEKTHVRNDIEVQPWWRKWRSIDWGWSTSSTCVLWHTYDPDKDQVITYRELYGKEIPDRELCERIKMMTPAIEHIDMTVADPSMWAGGSNERGLSRAEIFLQYGVSLTKAENKRSAGFARVQNALDMNTKLDPPEPFWVCTPDCFNLRRTLPTLSYDKSGEDIEQRGAEDHAFDSLRYGLLATPAFFGQQEAVPQPLVYRRF